MGLGLTPEALLDKYGSAKQAGVLKQYIVHAC